MDMEELPSKENREKVGVKILKIDHLSPSDNTEMNFNELTKVKVHF